MFKTKDHANLVHDSLLFMIAADVTKWMNKTKK